jgi:PAS domain S-box-containing protein
MPDRTPPPVHLKEKILQRIAAEPARVETDAGGGIVAINPAFTALCGYTFAEIVGRKPGSFLQGEKTEPDAVRILREGVRHGHPCEVEMFNYHKDGSIYRVHIRMDPLRDDAGAVTGFLAVEREIPGN